MRKNIKTRLKHVLSVLLLSGVAAIASAADAEQIAKGKSLFLNKKKGNCIACHMINDSDAKLAGMQGPPIVAMQARFPDIALLRAQVWDATVRNPNTIMPPFGRHWILSESEIDAIVAYIYQF